MRPLPLGDIARWCEARLLADSMDSAGDVASSSIDAVAIDTRKLDPADGRRVLFVALRGENHDAHDHLDAAIAGGAAALLVSRAIETDVPQLLCGDTEQALGDLAGGMQQGRAAKVLALTGSNGKTSVKTLLFGILERSGKAYANPGNRNNEIGLPLAVLDAPEDAQFAVYEMGAGKPGDIAYLTSIARPDVALVNNIMPAHLERMGTLLGVAQTKGAIYEALPADGTAVINADDAFAPYFGKLAAGRHVLRYGLEASADITARGIALHGEHSRFELVTPLGNAAIALPLPGRHNVMNAMAAAGMAIGAGVGLGAIRDGLCQARQVPGRQIAHPLADGAVLIDDSYNANPGSVEAAIAALAAAGGESWLVLGDMAELGEGSELLHAQVGDSARAKRIARLYATGAYSRATARAFGPDARHFADQAALIEALRRDLRPGVRVLVKGSRASAMDKVVAALLADHDQAREARMLLELTRWLHGLDHIRFFALFSYITFRGIMSALTALGLSLWMGPTIISRLAQLKGGQPIRTDGPQSHFSKAGTPTMGGALILASIALSTLLWSDLHNRYVWIVLGVLVAFGGIGWQDDWIKIVKRDPNGMRSRTKYALQSICGLVAACLLYWVAKDAPVCVACTTFYVPLLKDVAIPLGMGFIAVAYFWIVGFSNAVNLTDGLDGLAIMPSVLVASALGVFAYLSGNAVFAQYLQIPAVPGAGEMVIFCAAIAGAGLGFLWFNTYPAMVFMGDIGALALGAALATVAVIVRQEIVLAIMGGIFVVETLSVIIQVASFKLTGKRVFRMAPIHHHFELKGWPEPRVIVRFWIISVMLVLVGLATLKVR